VIRLLQVRDVIYFVPLTAYYSESIAAAGIIIQGPKMDTPDEGVIRLRGEEVKR